MGVHFDAWTTVALIVGTAIPGFLFAMSFCWFCLPAAVIWIGFLWEGLYPTIGMSWLGRKES